MVLLGGLLAFAIGTGDNQVEVNWGHLVGVAQAVPKGSLVHVLQLVSGPKKGMLRLESVDVDGYEGMELVRIAAYRGGPDDIPFIGDIPAEKQGELQSVKGYRLLPNQEGMLDYIVLTFRTLKDDVSGPFKGKVIYKWFGFPFVVSADTEPSR